MPNTLTTMINSLVSLFLLMALGYLCRKARWIDDHVNAGLTSLLLKLSMPCSIMMSMQREFSSNLMFDSFWVLGASFLVYLIEFGLGLLLVRLLKAKPHEKKVWLFAAMFSNVGYAGFPIMEATYGADGLIFTSMANVSFNLVVYSLGAQLFQPSGKTSRVKHILLNPPLLATAAGFLLFMTSSRLPKTLGDAASFMSATTTPLSMLIVGSILAKSDIRKIFAAGRTYAILFMRLLAVPALTFLIFKPVIHNPAALGVTVLLTGMPAASLTAIFAEQYKGNAALASQIIFLSTVFSLVTIPLITLFLS